MTDVAGNTIYITGAASGMGLVAGKMLAELAYEYAFLRGEHSELAGSLGIH